MAEPDTVEQRPEPDPVQVSMYAVDGAVVVGVDGEVDMLSSHHLWAAVERAFGEADGRPLVIDLSGVRFLDSHGLSALARAAETARTRDTRLRVVVPPSQAARRSIELCGLDKILPLRESVADALAG